MVNQYWKHNTSGETYAVQVDDQNKNVISACGPLYYKEATQANLDEWNFNNDAELVDDLNEHREDYSLNEARYEE